jgi:threonylcarbamoyladenosine tRNA methylthiotransferase MtaB
LWSRPAAEIEAEVHRLVERGHREVVLTGIHLGHYGIDLSRGRPKAQWTRLWHLLERLDRLPGEFRIRLSSLEAAEARDELVRTIIQSARVCPHLHLCLQSGSDQVLMRMKRRYRAASFLERCRRLRQALDLPAITTDVIVGFPGETEADFQATCRVVREVGFAQIHIFPFSPRKGTPAASMPDQVPPAVIADRKARLAELARESERTYLGQLLERRLEVLVEGMDPSRTGQVIGTACRRVPVVLPGSAVLIRRLVPVRAVGVLGDRIQGSVAEDTEREQGSQWRPEAVAGNQPLAGPGRLALPLLGSC